MMTEQETEKEFASRLLDGINQGLIIGAIFLGRQLGLFDVMAQQEQQLTSQEIADLSHCKER